MLALTSIGAVAMQLFASDSGFVAVFAGFWLVLGGTLVTARLSYSETELLALRDSLVAFWRDRRRHHEPLDLEWFLKAATLYRRGKIRPAELAARRIEAPCLRRGFQMVLDGFPREMVALALQKEIAEERDRARRPVDLLRAMAGYAPTLGMLGTLLGLVQMLFGLGAGEVDRIGNSMGFAMLTTVYGLVLSNLLLKPLSSKLEQIGRRANADSASQMQAAMMLFDRPHARFLQEVMHREPSFNPPAPRPALSLAVSR